MTNIRPKDAPAASTVQGGDTFLIDGATGVRALAVASVPVADANGNAAINRLTEGYATTATAAGTTVLTVASARMQYFTGSTTQTVTLPVVTTLPALGFSFSFQNNSTGVVTINSSGGNLVKSLAPNASVTLICILLTGTTAASWQVPGISAGQLTNSLGADVNLNVAANFFDGPSVAQGSVGTWWAAGTVSVSGVNADQVWVKLWDGTTVIASCVTGVTGSTQIAVSLSGFLASPAANIRMSVRNISGTTGKILFNTTGNSKDSTVSAYRIA